MANKAHVVLRGTVMSEPKTGTSQNGSTTLKLNVAVITSKKDPNPKNPKFPYVSDYYNVTAYGAVAENAQKFSGIKQGSKVIVIGNMCMGEPYQTKDGRTLISPLVTASELEVIGQSNFSGKSNSAPAQATPVDEEVPF